MILQERTTTELLLARSYWERARTCNTVGGFLLATYFGIIGPAPLIGNKLQIAMLLHLVFILGIFATTGHSYPQRYISKYGGTCSNIPTSPLGPHASVILDS